MTMEEKIDLILRLLQDRPTVAVASTSVAIADAADLDSQFGDPEIKTLVPAFKWPGEQHKGKRMSQTGDAAYLLALASQLDWAASRDDAEGKTWTSTKTGETKPSSDFKRRDAARARGWAQRIKDGLVKVDAYTDGEPF
jgi:hypothetical protein